MQKTMIDLFAGIGGFTLGFEAAGFECIGHCEIDRYAQRSYYAIHGKKEGAWLQMMLPLFDPKIYPHAILLPQVFHARILALADEGAGFQEHDLLSFLRLLELSKAKNVAINPDGLSLKMLRICFQLAEEKILRPFSVRWPKAGTTLNTRFSTLKTLEYPKTGSGCSLSDTLEPEVSEKYFLSSEQTAKILSSLSKDHRENGSTTPQESE